MSSNTPGYTDELQETQPQQPEFPSAYRFTPEERKVMIECNKESFWYRSLPLAAFNMAATQFFILRGYLTTSSRFGPIPKLLFAGGFGYLLGKASYMKECQDKMLKLENSPLADFVRKSRGVPPETSSRVQSEPNDRDMQSFDMYQPTDAPTQMPNYNRDYEYGLNSELPMQRGRVDDYSAPVQSYMEEEEPKKKAILYEDLRQKNRENYEVTLTQKAETLLKPSPEVQPKTQKKKQAKNIYGDVWEE